MLLLPLLAVVCGATEAPKASETSSLTNLFLKLRLLETAIKSNGVALMPGVSYVQSGEQWVRVSAEFLSAAAPARFVSRLEGVEMAERLNAQAMNAYRERWEKHLAAPHSTPPPRLYPAVP